MVKTLKEVMILFRLKQTANIELKEYLYEVENCSQLISDNLLSILPKDRPIVFACIGTDRSTGDSLGPLIGEFTKERIKGNFHIYGDLEEPIHAVNLNERVSHIYSTFQDPFVIGIDSCLGKFRSIGKISVEDGPIRPGAGVGKDLLPVGNIHIKGIVNVQHEELNFFVLQNTRLNTVYKMAKVISKAILLTEENY
jgi:putative sporulation protein YyaC